MKTYFRVLSFVKPYWLPLVISIVFTILFALFNGLSIYLSIPMLDALFQESSNIIQQTTPQTVTGSKGFFVDFFNNLTNSFQNLLNQFIFTGSKLDALLNLCIVLLLVFFLKNIFGYFQSYFLANVEQGVMRDIRNKAYEHLHQLPMSYFKNERIGNLISRLTNDVNVVLTSISLTFFNLIREPLTIIVFLGIAVSISWQLTLLAILILPFAMIVISTIGLKLRKQSRLIQEKMADITSVIQETTSGVKVVKAFGMEDFENKKFQDETNRFRKLMLKITRIRNLSSPITEFLSVAIGVSIIYYGGSLVLVQNQLKASEFLGFILAIFQLMRPIKELSAVNNRIQESSAAGDRIFEIIDTEPNIKSIVHPIHIDHFNYSIRFEDVSFHYDDSDELILQDINFEIYKGEIIALVGPSGSGKTTLVDLIPRFYDPTSGTIFIDNIDIKKIDIKNLRKLMGIVTQETILFNGTVKSNIAYGLDDCPLEKVIEAAKIANAHNFIMELPNGYDTMIGERGLKISGGQRQRLSIARALLKNPEILIFDEATSALDSESEILVQEALERLMENRTTFVIAHRLSTIRNATRIFVIEEGRIVQSGSHQDLIKEDYGLYKKLYELQFQY